MPEDQEGMDGVIEEEQEDKEPRVETSTEFLLEATKPTVNAIYDNFISRDLAVGYLTDPKQVGLIVMYASLISDLLFIKRNFIAHVYNADLKAFINANRSMDGFERRQETTVTSISKKTTEDKTKRGWFKR
jgi:hypothetical protein